MSTERPEQNENIAPDEDDTEGHLASANPDAYKFKVNPDEDTEGHVFL